MGFELGSPGPKPTPLYIVPPPYLSTTIARMSADLERFHEVSA